MGGVSGDQLLGERSNQVLTKKIRKNNDNPSLERGRGIEGEGMGRGRGWGGELSFKGDKLQEV